MRFIVLGTGLTGLACAAGLREDGHEVVLLEKGVEVGGLAKSFRIDGYTFDYGPHLLFGAKVLGLLGATLAPNLEFIKLSRTMERMYFKNKYFKFPFEPKNLLVQMDLTAVPGVFAELLQRKLRRNTNQSEPANLEDWVIHYVGKRLYEYISLGSYIYKLYGLSGRDASKDWGIQKLRFLASWRDKGLVQLAMKVLKEEKEQQKAVVTYPISGIDNVPRQLARNLVQGGAEIRLDAEATTIERKNGRLAVFFRTRREERRVEGDFVISTTPITALMKMLEPSVPQKMKELSNRLRYRSLLLLYLCIKKEQVLDYLSIYFTEPDYPFRRITEFAHQSRSMAPEGRTSLCVEITCFEGDEICYQAKDDIFRLVVEHLERGGFIKESDIEGYHLLRIPFAYPVYDLQFKAILGPLLEYLGTFENLISIGRQGLFFYNAMNTCMLSGYQIGKRLSANPINWKETIQGIYSERQSWFETKNIPLGR